MAQKHKSFDIKKLKRFLNVRDIFIFLFIVLNITDVITTLMAKSKHTMAFEINPIFAITNSAFVMYSVKTLGVLFLLWYMLRRYPLDKSPVYRYFMIYIMVLIAFILVGATVNNYLYYKTPVEDVGKPIPREEKTKAMLTYIGELKPLSDVGSETKRIVIPPIFSIFLLNMVQFIVWRGFEKKMIENNIVNMRLIR